MGVIIFRWNVLNKGDKKYIIAQISIPYIIASFNFIFKPLSMIVYIFSKKML